eukprot:TRINITY_DN35470_c0_g1_i1.p1 TRINITY_DN35470_c0_g1~~TRINITY_DN35470_c0_g1_i1.p1  ORF type:complete len:336 (+),score=43.79 TRINITY_DN35470_c0_g1_i1:89-1096(+)
MAPSGPSNGALCCLEGLSTEVLARTLASSTGEVLTLALVYPLELVKNRLQATANAVDGGFAYTGFADGLTTILRDEGFRGFFTGLQPVLMRSFLADFVCVYVGEFLLGAYSVATGWQGPFSDVALRLVGGWAAMFVTLPMEAITTRLSVARSPISVWTAAGTLWKEGGLKAFWRGIGVSVLLALNPALTHAAVDWIRHAALARRRLRRQQTKNSEVQGGRRRAGGEPPMQMTWPEAMLAGVLAKTLTLLVVYPLMRGKALLQSKDRGSSGLVRTLQAACLADGIRRGLYQGLGAQLSKSVLSSSLKYGVKERAEAHFLRALKPSPQLAPSAEQRN